MALYDFNSAKRAAETGIFNIDGASSQPLGKTIFSSGNVGHEAAAKLIERHYNEKEQDLLK